MGLYFAGNSLSGSASKGRAAEHPRGVRRIRKAAKPPTAAQGGGPYKVFYRYMRGSGRSPLRHGFAVPPLPKGEASKSAVETHCPLWKQ